MISSLADIPVGDKFSLESGEFKQLENLDCESPKLQIEDALYNRDPLDLVETDGLLVDSLQASFLKHALNLGQNISEPKSNFEESSQITNASLVGGFQSPRSFSANRSAIDFDDEEEVYEDIPAVGEEVNEEDCDKVGRWTFSKGAARKPSVSKTVSKSHTMEESKEVEKERFEVHSESQRMIREAPVCLPQFRPKQYSSFAEFRLALRGQATSSAADGTKMPETIAEAQNYVTVGLASPTKVAAVSGDIVVVNDIPIASVASPLTEQNVEVSVDDLIGVVPSIKVNHMLPPDLPPPRFLKANHDDIIDLDDEEEPIKHVDTSLQRLITRFSKQIMPPQNSQSQLRHQPVEYSIVQKVVDEKGDVQLKLDSVVYQPSTSETVNFTDRRKWSEHRLKLREIMRSKRLKQYEERVLQYQPTGTTANRENDDSDEDEEWSVGDEDETSLDSESSEEEDREDMDDEDDDDVRGTSLRKHNPLIDDEAEEDNDEECVDDKTEETADQVVVKISPQLKAAASCRATALSMANPDLEDPDDFTDLLHQDHVHDSFQTQGVSKLSHFLPQPNCVEPGDIDLFASESTLMPDKTFNMSRVMSSTRCDPSVPQDQSTAPSSERSSWNNTPYSLLYSQKHTGFEDSPNESAITLKTLLIADESLANTQTSTEDTLILNPMGKASVVGIQTQDTILLDPVTETVFDDEICADAPTQDTVLLEQTTQNDESTQPILSDISQLKLDEFANKPQLVRAAKPIHSPGVSDNSQSSPCATMRRRIRYKLDSTSTSSMASDYKNAGNSQLTKVAADTKLFDEDAKENFSSDPEQEEIVSEDEELKNGIESDDEQAATDETDEEDAQLELFLRKKNAQKRREQWSKSSDEDESDDTEESENEELASFQLQSKHLAKRNEKLVSGAFKFKAKDFLDEEAELSGDEIERAQFADEREDDGADSDIGSLKDFVDENVAGDASGKLRREVERIHMRMQADSDQRELRYLKEIFFEDGDLYDEEGRTRERRFRWRGLDNEDGFANVDVDLDDEGDDGDDADINANGWISGGAGVMSRWLLHGSAAGASSNPTKQDDAAVQASDCLSSPNVKPTVSTNRLKSPENLISRLGSKAILHSSQSNSSKLLNANGVRDPLQRTILGMLSNVKEPMAHGDEPVAEHHAHESSTSVGCLSQPQLMKRGSFLSRSSALFTASQSCLQPVAMKAKSLLISEAAGSEDLIDMAPSDFRTKSCVLGLRNKIGMSCFSVKATSANCLNRVSSTVDSVSLSSSQRLPKESTFKKRLSTGLDEKGMKKARVNSIFSVL